MRYRRRVRGATARRAAAVLTVAAAALGAGLAGAVGPAGAAPPVERLAGGDRFATAAAVSAATFPDGAPVAYVASGEAFPDALAAGPAAAAAGGPVLLVTRSSVPGPTSTEIRRLGPDRIVVVGGTGAVDDGVLRALAGMAPGGAARTAGEDRYATAAAVSAGVFGPGVPVVYAAAGEAFADALAAGAAGAGRAGPVLLVERDRLPGPSADELRRLRPRSIVVVGGLGAVSAAVEAELRAHGPTGRAAGADRFATAAALSAVTFQAPVPAVVLASGVDFPDALSGAVHAGRTAAGPMLPVQPRCVPDAVLAEIDRLRPSRLVVVGGRSAVGDGAAALEPCPAPIGSFPVRLTAVAELRAPVALADAGDGTLYVAEKGGRVWALRDGRADPTPALDLSGQVSGGGEQGLLGIAVPRDRPLLFVDYTDRAGDTHVVEYPLVGRRADTTRARELLFVDQPFSNHNGGQLVLTPDGLLWIGLGDGGSAGDPRNHAQNLSSLLGKILRIDPREIPGSPYGIPNDNPFFNQDGARGEIWAYGLRNPWRFSFDRVTGDLWIGDVGQDAWEEVDFAPGASRGGENYGWPLREGRHPFRGAAPAGAVDPIWEYGRSGGNCTVVGGHVYRGDRIPRLRGAYLYGDFCAGRILALRQEGGRVVEQSALGPTVARLSSFGEDVAGEVYVLSLDGTIYRLDP